MKSREALQITHTLSSPSKMPCFGYSIPASRCITGGKLRKVKNSICSFCYALKGRYVFPNVLTAMEKRYQSLTHPQWVDAMTALISSKRKKDYFRWHDSGDLQGLTHLENIVEIARRLPSTKFWLPTREYTIVRQYIQAGNVIPDNLNIRLSAFMMDGEAPLPLAKRLGLTTSGVSSEGVTCPAPKQNNSCGDCRACWDKGTLNVNYKKH